MINENLIPYNQSFQESTTASLQAGTSGWVTYTSGTLSVNTTDAFSGYQCLKVTKVNSSADSGVYTSSTNRAPATANLKYSASAYVKVPSGQESGIFKIRLQYFNNTTPVSTVDSSATTITSAMGWTRLSITNSSTSSTITHVELTVYQDDGSKTSGNYYLVDALKIENSTYVTQFIEPYTLNEEITKTRQALTPLPFGDPETKPYIEGLQLRADVSFNGLVLNTMDENGVIWICTDIEGWWNLPEPEVPDIARGLDDGSYDVRGRWKARALNLKGSILPPRPDLAPSARKKLIEAAALVYSGGWLLVNESPVKSAYVRMVGAPTIENVHARGRIDFSIPLRAGDPIKYSWDANDSGGLTTTSIGVAALGSTTGATTVTNSGNTNVAMSISITGPMISPGYVKNLTTGTQIKIIKNLRAAGFDGGVSAAGFSRTSGTATLTMTGSHGLLVGDVVTVSGFDSGNILMPINGTRTITAATDTTISFLDDTVGIESADLVDGVVTVTCKSAHGLSTSDVAYISGLGSPFDGTYTVTRVDNLRFSYSRPYSGDVTAYEGTLSQNKTYVTDAGSAVLTYVDTLELDTYNTTVLYRGIPDSARSTLDVDVNWIKLVPGDNSLILQKAGSSPTVSVKYRSGWIG